MGKREGKTEAPSERKKQDAKKKGTVSKSQDLGPWITVLVATYIIPMLVRSMSDAVTSGFMATQAVAEQPSATAAVRFLGQSLQAGLFAVLPFLVICAGVAIVSQLAQTGLVLSLHPLKPDFRRLDPVQGVKKLFSANSLWETVKQVAKAGVIAWLCWPYINRIAVQLSEHGRVPLMEGMSMSARSLTGMTRSVCFAIIIISLFDFMYQRRNKLLDLKMTKQEVRDESRSTEGDPLVKQRIRAMQMAMSRNRMMSAIPNASVVVTNPTHVAIALQYDPLNGGAPRVVAAGIGSVAARIREKAIASGVPIVEAKPLARALWRSCEVGDEIPIALYEAVAKVLAFVRRLRGGLPGATALPLPSAYHVDQASLEAISGSRHKRPRPAA
ncbi:MAG: EscU/YscU/HrcU family type III secretion system export apparatus switch protein [Ilumatobacteraceae bacterium]